jgi:hypothetical protein
MIVTLSFNNPRPTIMEHRSLLLVTLFLITSPATIARAQSAATNDGAIPFRHGFFVSAGAGIGSGVIDCSTCSRDRKAGPVAYVRVGGTINPHLRLGIESDGWKTTTFEIDDKVAFVTADLYLYPSVTNNFWIKGGFGLAAAKESVPGHEVKASGAAFAGGIGYDWKVGHGDFVIGQFATYLRQVSGTVNIDGADSGLSASTNILELGIGLGFRH